MVGLVIVGCLIALVGAALIETPLIGLMIGDNGVVALIFGIIFGLLFLVPGIGLNVYAFKEMIKNRKSFNIKPLLEVFKPGFKEATGKNYLDSTLVNFRNHYSEFLSKERISENEKIQNDVTQIFRNILDFHKNRLQRLGLTCELAVKRMKYTKADGIYTKSYSDGKYSITDVTEEVAAKTIYKKDGKEIFKKIDRDVANYTITCAQTVGEKRIICPNCGAETTREALLDGCDYCGTKFKVEDLGSRIAVFAFRPDAGLRYEKYRNIRNKTIMLIVSFAILAVFLGFTGYAIYTAPDMLAKADGGIFLTLLASIFAIVVASPVYIAAFVIVNFKYFLGAAIILVPLGYLIYRIFGKKKRKNMLSSSAYAVKKIRELDPEFSLTNFYSGVQNKLSAVIYAENEKQIQAFAIANLTGLLGKYSNVVGVDVDNMSIENYYTNQGLQLVDVAVTLYLTRFTGKKCKVRKEKMMVKVAKSIDCKTQVVCAPSIMTCKGCGNSLDLLQGKECPYCGRVLDLEKYDWVIAGIK